MKLHHILFLFLVSLLFVACEKETLSPQPDPTEPNSSVMGAMFNGSGGSGSSLDSLACFEDFVYPLSVNMPDGSLLTINDMDGFDTLEVWYDNNPYAATEPTLNYPVDVRVVDENGTLSTQTVNSDDEMEDLFEACLDYYDEDDDCWEHEDACYEFVYPLSVTMPDGSPISIQDEDDWDLVDTWYDNNPTVEDEPTLNFPLDLIDGDDNVLTVNDIDELEEAFEECYDWEHEDECYEFVYPITLIMPDGTSIAVNDEDDWEAVENWYDANPTETADPTFSFPLDLIDEDGNIETVNDLHELEDAFESCYGWDDEEDCFELIYPVVLNLPDSSSVTANDAEELINAFEAWYAAHPNSQAEPMLDYPVDILFDDGSTQTINSDPEMDQAFDDCDD